MICKDIIRKIEEVYPKEAALGFDNVGLLVGRSGREVRHVFLALDATDEVIHAAKAFQADMLITHHPLIFSPMKSITDSDFIGRRVIEIIHHDISYYAMHTNYDVMRMAKLSSDILGLTDTDVLDPTREFDGKEEGIGRIGKVPETMTVRECCEYVKEKLNLEAVKVFGSLEKEVNILAVSPGSGKSAIKPALCKGADVLVTGDIGHHEGIDAAEQGLAVIDAGHYGTEYIFMEDMKAFLHKELPELIVMEAEMEIPFRIL